MTTKLSDQIQKLKTYFREDIWLVVPKNLSKSGRFYLNAQKVVYIVFKGFVSDRCSLHASAMTFITLLSVIPVLALSMAVADLLGFGSAFIQEILKEYSEGVPSQVQAYLERLLELVQKTEFLALGVIGVFFLLWIYFRAMAKLEFVLDHIWGVATKRTLIKKISLYIGLMFLVTIMFVLATSINAAVKSDDLLAYIGQSVNATAYRIMMQNISIIGIVAALTCFYTFMPNTKVNFWPAAGSAFIAGITWLAWQKLCITFQIGISNSNAIYGAFASIPITLYWIYVNWIIVLFGAELSFAWQNFSTFSMEIDSKDVSPALRRRLCFRIVYDVCRRYRQGAYWNSREFHETSRIPIRLLNNILQMLKNRGIIIQLEENDSWVPAREAKQISMKDIEFAARGAVDGRFEHIGKMPAEVARILKDHETTYFGDLEKRNFADLLDKDSNLNETELETI